MISVAIAGATGYTGVELINILLRHPDVKITGLFSTTQEPKPISKIIPGFKERIGLECKKLDVQELISKCDLAFLALPHTLSMTAVPKLLNAGKKVIDLSSDYRLKDIRVYEKFFKVKHKDAKNLKNSVYGLAELYRQHIKKAKLIANPGCYATTAILALAPAVALNLIDLDSIIIDAKSGVSGAGKKVSLDFCFSEVNEDFKAYKVNVHPHMPEINQVLSNLASRKLEVTFVPHLLPLYRGILTTIYVKKTQKSILRLPKGKTQNLINLYKKFYKKEPFVRIRDEGDFPRIKDVAGTNFSDIGIKEEADKIIIIAALDNLLKGASGQAVQNMNIMYKFPETAGLL